MTPVTEGLPYVTFPDNEMEWFPWSSQNKVNQKLCRLQLTTFPTIATPTDDNHRLTTDCRFRYPLYIISYYEVT